MIRRSLSLRTELILLLGALVLLATASLGSIAYSASRTIVERAAVRELGITANARKQALLQFLTQQRARAGAVLKTASLGCAPDEIRCLRRVLADFVATESATAVQLEYRGRAPIVVGASPKALADLPPPAPDQIARFAFDSQGQPYYAMVVRGVTEDGEMVITLRGGAEVVDQIFAERYGLGQSGETFLTDAGGLFLTPHRYPTSAGKDSPIRSDAVQSCIGGQDGELLDQDYRGVAAVHSFRYIREIGGGCAVARIDQAEAFAPTNQIRGDVVRVSISLGVLAIVCSFLLAQLVSRPMKRLSSRARSLQSGDFDSPVPMGGPAEVQMFAETFAAMASSLKDSRSALEASNEQVRNILESISDGFVAFDRQGRCTYINERAAAFSRIPGDRLVGRPLWQIFLNHLSPSARQELRRSMQDRIPVHVEDFYAPFETWFEVDAYPTRDGLAVFGRDVTARKRIGERLEQAQRLESLGVLAGGIAHDFNNLLTGVIGNASVALDELPPSHSVRENLENVVIAGERAAGLTRQLLAYAGKGRFLIQPLDLSCLIREIAGLLQTSIPKTVELHMELPDDLPAIEADASQMQQLVMNLVINGAEALGEGRAGMVLVATSLQSVDQEYIDKTLAPDEIAPGEYVALDVHDTGSGMDEATIARIFDPFFTTKFAGRGLGLAAAMGIVRGHRGALRVYSSPGKGSSFRVLFPASAQPAVRRSAPASSPTLSGAETILIIDDEAVVRQAARSALERYGYTVEVAENGKDGIELFRRLGDRVSLVLLDMTMQVISGEETLGLLQSVRRGVPVILSSGHAETEATRRFAGKGLAGFIQKPYTAALLAEQIRKALASRP